MKGINKPSEVEETLFNRLASQMRKHAEDGTITCGSSPEELLKYRVSVQIGRRYLLQVIFSRDIGTYTVGFTKNPQNERCYNLTFSFQSWNGNPLRGSERIKFQPEMKRIARNLMEAFFGGQAPLLLLEPPATEGQKQLQIWGARLFCDQDWRPLDNPSEEGMRLFRDYYALH